MFCHHHVKNAVCRSVWIIFEPIWKFNQQYPSQSLLQPPKKAHMNYRTYQEKLKEKKAVKDADKEKVCMKFSVEKGSMWEPALFKRAWQIITPQL